MTRTSLWRERGARGSSALEAVGVDDGFDSFVEDEGVRLRRALVAAYGPQSGADATAAALAWAWEHWDRVQGMASPMGYLYRVGQSSLRTRRQPVVRLPRPTAHEPEIEPRLPAALEALTEHQRVCVLLVHGHAWTQVEVAELLDVSTSTVRNHLERGMAKLQAALGVTDAHV